MTDEVPPPPPPSTGRAGPSHLLVGGLVAVVVAVVLALILVQRFGRTYEDGLEVAAESAAIAADAAEPLQRMADDLIDFANAAETGLEDARTVMASAQVSVDRLGAALAAEVADTVEGVASLADRMAGFIETVERFIPGNRTSAAEDLRQIADGLAPVPEQLRTLGAQLQSTAEELADADATLVALRDSVADLGDELEALTPTIDDISTTTALLVERVDHARSRVRLDLWLARLVVILIGAILATGLIMIERLRGGGVGAAARPEPPPPTGPALPVGR